jgi:hypothetical protein
MALGNFVDGVLGSVVGSVLKIGEKVADWVPQKKEYYKNTIEKTKREMNEITKKPCTTATSKRYKYLAGRVQILESKLKNI